VTKERINKVIRSSGILMAAIAMLMLTDDCRAFPYRPSETLNLFSEYHDSVPPHSRMWKVVPESGSSGASILRFFTDISAETAAVCELRLPSPGSLGDIYWEAKSGQKKIVSGILLLPGFPAPCDVLPISLRESKVYEEKSEAGGRVFSRSYRVTFEAVSVAEARSMGWVKVENTGQAGLIMVAVTDGKGRPVVKQLWPADGSWWIYEETSLRRSWLIH
jgi:hypothetical protein